MIPPHPLIVFLEGISTGVITDETVKAKALVVIGPEAVSALQRLLACPDLNLEELKPETRAAIEEAEAVLAKLKEDSKP